MKRSIVFVLAALLVCLLAPQSHALLIGGPDIIAAPAFAIDDAPGATNFHEQAFNEQQNVLLGANLAVDGGSIAAGATVSSHMIFLNTPVGAGNASDLQVWTFDGAILGVMSDQSGTMEAASSSILGATGTTYPGSFTCRGMESNDWYQIIGPNQIEVYMQVSEPGDWIRVVTEADPAIPEPGTLLLLGSGLLGLVGVKKRKV